MTIAALLLAAGESTRMGRLKQLLDWDGQPLIAWQVEQLREAGVDEVVVVLGHASDEIRPHVPSTARVALNLYYRQGRATSLRRGAEVLPDTTEAIVILSVDQPRPAWLAKKLIERWRDGRPPVVSPRFARGYGHPILLDGSLLPDLRKAEDATRGLRGVIDKHAAAAVSVEAGNEAVDVDLNTPADYQAALQSYRQGEWSEPT